MKLLLINGNTSQFVTDACAAEARRSVSADTEIIAVTAAFGARIIGSRAENAIAQHAILELAAEHQGGCDGVVIAVSMDTGLPALREVLSVPVVGMTEAALLTACMLGGRFGVVTLGKHMPPIYRELIEAYGLATRLAAIDALDVAPAQFSRPDAMADQLQMAAQTMVANAGADCVILAGAALAGMQRVLKSRIAVPLLDGIECAVRQAELLVRMDPRKALAGSYARVGQRESAGLSDALRRLIGN
jgi:allantoin racemase